MTYRGVSLGEVRPESRVDLVRSSIGMAVRSGAPRPDITSKEADEVQKITTFSTGIAERALNPEDARRLIDYLSSEDVAETIAVTGLSPVVSEERASSSESGP